MPFHLGRLPPYSMAVTPPPCSLPPSPLYGPVGRRRRACVVAACSSSPRLRGCGVLELLTRAPAGLCRRLLYCFVALGGGSPVAI